MPYFTGSASSASDLLTKIRTHLTTDLAPADQWTLSGDVLHKDGCYVQITAETDTYEYLYAIGGTGIDGGNNLTGAPLLIGDTNGTNESGVSLCPVGSPSGLQFPVVYFLHVYDTPDEVYLIVRDDSTRYSHMFFGQSPVPNLPGTGNWYGAQVGNKRDDITSWAFSYERGDGFSGNHPCPMLGTLWANYNPAIIGNSNQINFFTHYQMDGWEWSHRWNKVESEPSIAHGAALSNVILDITPNSFNDQVILSPLLVSVYRLDNKTSIVLDIENLRITRIDNLQPEDIVTIGGEKWRLYPLTRKNASAPISATAADHSGAIAWAVRYDGP